ncbi:protein-L-isoaspartate O-methyltransferase [Sphingobium sp. SCG-1]|uniref:protein-L-isoaspartate O-methyltransferase family protein n=1 Tax=Sphingobium sp. SCG-1 TaxID=2072936 RepID=UPI000CD68EC5|nr:protein-L-isoaspartate O-methyltransferase [Sphingobium sp. SCG-1]AUW59072.1 protein-L-isoaspartate O-methyltransferase [Sphingobium sp. SCG-1]
MTETNFASMRAAMVESQLRTSDVSDVRVVEAMGHVPREDFVPAERKAMAYIDRPVPLGNGRSLNPPLATGRLLTEAAIKRGEKVLLVGAASGYTAAVLAEMGAVVTAIEEADVTGKADTFPGVTFVRGSLAAGYPESAPYNAIVIDGAVEEVPSALIDQLADGGRLTTGIIDKGISRLAFGRKSASAFGLTHIADIEMVSLPGFAKPKTFVF